MSDGQHSDAIKGGDRDHLSSPTLLHGRDVKLTLVIIGICAVLYFITTTFEAVSPLLTQNIAPEWFPRLLLWVIVLMSLILPFEHRFVSGGKKSLDRDREQRIPNKVIVTAGLLILVVASVEVFGTFLAMVFVCAALPILWGERRWKVLVPYVVIFTVVVAFVFTKILKVYFQPGIIGFGI